MADQHHSGRGGKREGAGRPKGAKSSNKTVRLYEWLTPDEHTYLRELLKQRRAKEKEEKK